MNKNLKKRDLALKKFAHYYQKLDKLKKEKAGKESVWNEATKSYGTVGMTAKEAERLSRVSLHLIL